MFTLRELNPKGVKLTPEMEQNIQILLERMNQVREKRGVSMIVTSGVRSLEDHKHIYAEQARRKGLKNYRIPMGSQHLKAAAVDIYDPVGTLFDWCKANEEFLVEVGLWCEDKDNQPRVHFQIYPPRSGRRFFKP